MSTKECSKCHHHFRANNHAKHESLCTGVYAPFVKRSECKHCKMAFEGLTTSERANHSRWCNRNPKHSEYMEVAKARDFKTTPEMLKRRGESVTAAHKAGVYKGSPQKGLQTKIKNGTNRHTPESKEKLRQKALASNHRRILRSTRKYIKRDGSEVLLDSSWEEALARRLDELGVDWERPKPVKWVDKNNKTHNYFPDFYLPQHDVYLDPKNDIVYSMSLEKIEVLRQTLPNLVIIRSLKECQEYVP